MKKGEISTEKLVGLVLLLAFLVITSGIIFLVYDEIDATKMSQFSCWITNGLKTGGILGKLMPSTCSMTVIEEKAGLQDITKMLTDTWWMYHKGEIDLGSTANEITVFQFINKEDISFEKLVERLVKFKGDAKVTDLKDSDFNYLQKGSEGPTLCFGKSIQDADYKLNKDQRYFIIYISTNRLVEINKIAGIDYADLEDVGSKIAISSTPNLEQEKHFICPSYFDLTEGITISKQGVLIGAQKT